MHFINLSQKLAQRRRSRQDLIGESQRSSFSITLAAEAGQNIGVRLVDDVGGWIFLPDASEKLGIGPNFWRAKSDRRIRFHLADHEDYGSLPNGSIPSLATQVVFCQIEPNDPVAQFIGASYRTGCRGGYR